MDKSRSKIPPKMLDILLNQGQKLHFDPLFSEESEHYFLGLLESGQKVPEDLTAYLWNQVRRDFRYFKSPPDWLQNPEWPFHRVPQRQAHVFRGTAGQYRPAGRL